MGGGRDGELPAKPGLARRTDTTVTVRDQLGQLQTHVSVSALQDVFTLTDAKQVDLGALHKIYYCSLRSVLSQ